MPLTSRLAPGASAGARRSPASGSVMSARWRGGGGPAEGLPDRTAGGGDGARRRRRPPGSARRSNEAGRSSPSTVLGQQVADQQPGLAVLDGLDLLDPDGAGEVSGEEGAADPSRPVGAARRARARARAERAGVRRVRSSRRSAAAPTTISARAGSSRSTTPAVADRSVSAAASGHHAEHQEAAEGEPGRRTPRTPASDREQRDRDDDPADQDRLVVVAEGLDRELLERARRRVDGPVADRQQRGGDAAQQRGERLRDGDRRGAGEQARETTGRPATRGRRGPAARRATGVCSVAGMPAGSAAAARRMGARAPADRSGAPSPA